MIGLLGGSFNPVHWGHLYLAATMRKVMELERVELVPCAVPPHKGHSNMLPFALRVDLLNAALLHMQDEARDLRVNCIEASLPHPSYTWNLVNAWVTANNAVPLFILGDEAFAKIHTWFRGLELPTITNMLIIGRFKSTADAYFAPTVKALWPQKDLAYDKHDRLFFSPSEGMRCTFMPAPDIPISATQLRTLWSAKKPIDTLTPVFAELEKARSTIAGYW